MQMSMQWGKQPKSHGYNKWMRDLALVKIWMELKKMNQNQLNEWVAQQFHYLDPKYILKIIRVVDLFAKKKSMFALFGFTLYGNLSNPKQLFNFEI